MAKGELFLLLWSENGWPILLILRVCFSSYEWLMFSFGLKPLLFWYMSELTTGKYGSWLKRLLSFDLIFDEALNNLRFDIFASAFGLTWFVQMLLYLVLCFWLLKNNRLYAVGDNCLLNWLLYSICVNYETFDWTLSLCYSFFNSGSCIFSNRDLSSSSSWGFMLVFDYFLLLLTTVIFFTFELWGESESLSILNFMLKSFYPKGWGVLLFTSNWGLYPFLLGASGVLAASKALLSRPAVFSISNMEPVPTYTDFFFKLKTLSLVLDPTSFLRILSLESPTLVINFVKW